MKLELKHLAPYLPYGLECKWNKSKPFELKGLSSGNNSVSNDLWTWKDKDSYLVGYLYECYPILRPLSDLNKEVLEAFNFIEMPMENKDLELLSYGFMRYCFANHIDIFGLIEKGLAINKNTL